MPWMTRMVVYANLINAMDEKDAKERAEMTKKWLLTQHGIQNVVITVTYFAEEQEDEHK